MARSRWQEIGDYKTREEAQAAIAAQRPRGDKACKYRIREERRRSLFRSYGEYQVETRYIVAYLCPGVY